MSRFIGFGQIEVLRIATADRLKEYGWVEGREVLLAPFQNKVSVTLEHELGKTPY